MANQPGTNIVAVTPQISKNELNREQIELLKRTIAKGTTDDEFALFVNTARRLGLDPFAKQIWCVKRWDSRANREVMSIQVSIDGFRVVAARSAEYDGQDGPYWCGPDGVWKDVWLSDVPPAASKVIVYRKGAEHPFTGIATYRSYAQLDRSGKPTGRWPQMPDVMTAKCAEALALRKAFPSQLSGVYAPEEMEQAVDVEPAPYRPLAIQPRQAKAQPERQRLPERTERAPEPVDAIDELTREELPDDVDPETGEIDESPLANFKRQLAECNDRPALIKVRDAWEATMKQFREDEDPIALEFEAAFKARQSAVIPKIGTVHRGDSVPRGSR